MSDAIVFKNEELLPAAWRAEAGDAPLQMFNPALLRHGDAWILAYRVVAGRDLKRRIALCHLDPNFRVVAGSPFALSDRFRFQKNRDYAPEATSWFADPRLYRLGGRVFIYWNSGWHEPRNYQFLQELSPADFTPIGEPRELVLRGLRRPLEKNWTLFGDGPFYAVYSVTPHRILQFSLEGDGDIEFSEAFSHEWTCDYAPEHGGLRGGAPPLKIGSEYFSLCHTVHHAPEGYRYLPAVYRFAATPPFAPTATPRRPLALPNPFGAQRLHPKLNPAVSEVIYPCGAAIHDGSCVVSYGLNDERCAIATVSFAQLTECAL